MSYASLLAIILPVFALIGAGVALRRCSWLTEEADSSLLRVVVNFLYPCLILDSVLGNPALRTPSNLAFPPLIAFVTIAGGIEAAYVVGKFIGLELGQGLRTFAFSSGVYNYAYIPITLVTALYDKGTLGVLLVHNVGCEAAIWTVGILMLSGLSIKEGWRRAINPPTIALLLGVGLNLTGAGRFIPGFILAAMHLSAQCAVPLGLILTGATLENFILNNPLGLFDRKVTSVSCALRVMIYPIIMITLARLLPVSVELKRVMVIQAAMPAGILPIVIAKHFGGRPQIAAQVVIGTTVASLFLMPLWLRLGLSWTGVGS